MRGIRVPWGAESHNQPHWFEDQLVLTSNVPDGIVCAHRPLHQGSNASIDPIKIVSDETSLMPVSLQMGTDLLVFRRSKDRPFTSLELVHVNDRWKTSAGFFGAMDLYTR